jgi:hypothetical protein
MCPSSSEIGEGDLKKAIESLTMAAVISGAVVATVSAQTPGPAAAPTPVHCHPSDVTLTVIDEVGDSGGAAASPEDALKAFVATEPELAEIPTRDFFRAHESSRATDLAFDRAGARLALAGAEKLGRGWAITRFTACGAFIRETNG